MSFVWFPAALAAEAYTTSSANNLYTALSFQYQRIVRPSNITSVAVKFGVSSINFLVITPPLS
ncbi:hypothetical protein DPMN_185279 [Dreissena polymorpha]|uniref:Uncharacterized protein n=1 Tax=Dreissena polymorpha TaxID=45954 RepID=A0A9D4DKN4_DREPO|nr:hypothetical protein DPMN_185279 [Dreissena polymorpha]